MNTMIVWIVHPEALFWCMSMAIQEPLQTTSQGPQFVVVMTDHYKKLTAAVSAAKRNDPKVGCTFLDRSEGNYGNSSNVLNY